MSVADRITEKLQHAFAPIELQVIDQSYLHAGHSEAGAAGESHFRVVIVAAAFDGLSRLARHRAITKVLAEELAGPVHALSVEARGAAAD
ncbi:BolA-like protein [Parvularcula bermudensis HTCC2503]|uniref:BolA-like protein n=1 Tax=Parvularcula bermudensis (strain ATCC BAA-594 / HTCC2503 / KCTC 12087) TaxID=314260 RepID=E0TB47_PARBH|nr:BolA family protein [Parvularcula bermudensis]ADM08256.1 BolA-like protein [Parvularcula bermudensis HTCC2503]